jgi:hypothetical protein
MHDLHKWTALAVPELLAQLKANGYKVVHIRAKDTLATLPEYDAMVSAAGAASQIQQRTRDLRSGAERRVKATADIGA